METLPLAEVRWVVSSLPQWESNRALLSALHAAGYRGSVAAVVLDAAHGRLLKAAGVAMVLNPLDDAADHAARELSARLADRETS